MEEFLQVGQYIKMHRKFHKKVSNYLTSSARSSNRVLTCWARAR